MSSFEDESHEKSLLSEYNEQEEEESEKEASEKEEDEEEDERQEEEDEEEDEVEEEEEKDDKLEKKRCKRRRKTRVVCKSLVNDEEEKKEVEEEEEEEEDEEDEEGEEGEEEGKKYEEKKEESDKFDLSSSSSVFSAISFEWENDRFVFDELCDPGTIDSIYAVSHTTPEIFDDCGKVRYLKICKALSITPMLWLLNALCTEEVDLGFRQIDSKNIRALCGALETNAFVERLILKFNKLNESDCFYIGLMLRYNEAIKLLDLTGCRIGPEGVEHMWENLLKNEVLEELNLSKCNIDDDGVKLLSQVLMRSNSPIMKLDLSYNRLCTISGEILAKVLNFNKCITHLNLRYNYLFDPVVLKIFFRAMTVNDSITHLDLSWNGLNGPETGEYISSFLKKNKTIFFLDLSDNRFQGKAILKIKQGLARSKNLETLRFGKNPASAEDLEVLLAGAKACSTLKLLDLEELWVNRSFIKALKKIKSEREFEAILGGVYGSWEIQGPDYPKLILQRAEYEAKKPKKKKQRRDFGHLMWSLGDEPLTEEEFKKRLSKLKPKVSKDLISELIAQFVIPPKNQLIDVTAMREKYLLLFPDSTPPPPPKIKAKKKKGPKIQKFSEEPAETEEEAAEKEGEGDEEKSVKMTEENLKKSKTKSSLKQKMDQKKDEKGEGEGKEEEGEKVEKERKEDGEQEEEGVEELDLGEEEEENEEEN